MKLLNQTWILKSWQIVSLLVDFTVNIYLKPTSSSSSISDNRSKIFFLNFLESYIPIFSLDFWIILFDSFAGYEFFLLLPLNLKFKLVQLPSVTKCVPLSQNFCLHLYKLEIQIRHNIKCLQQNSKKGIKVKNIEKRFLPEAIKELSNLILNDGEEC